MGKRKVRRLAAKSAVNRRVKLDLFADPPEEEMGKSNNEEVGGNQEQDHSASVPTSPSSSGQNQENPLLLLGQYSDDELDDDASKLQKDADVMGNLMEADSKVKEHVGAHDSLGSDKDEVTEGSTFRLESDQANSPKELKAGDVEAIENTYVDTEHCGINLMDHARVSELSESQANGHVIEHWKLVLHEESNQYYYWNTITGETSWVVPEALAVDAQPTDEHRVSTSADEETVANGVEAHTSTEANVDMAIYGQVLNADGRESSNFISKDAEVFASTDLKSQKVYESSQSVGQYADNVTASYGNFSVYSSLSDHLPNPASLQHQLSNEEKDVHLSRESDFYAIEDTHASQLVKYGEVLLHRLSTLSRSVQQPEGYEGIRKEIDIRISDCRALSSYGLVLLPFWWHTDVQLKQIESTINKCEASAIGQPEEFSDLTAKQNDPRRGTCLEVTVKNDNGIVTSESESHMAKNENDRTESILLKTNFEAQGSEHQQDIAPEENPIPNSTSVPTLIYSAEEDMDVEMEVDETHPPSPPSEHFFQTNMPLAQYPSLTSDESNVPPPEEEWIPPPPPEVEPLPPPPPPETELNPPEDTSTSFPSSYAQAISYPIPDHYNVGYHIPAYDYYSATASEVPNGNYYDIAGSSQVTESEPPAYYEPLASSNLTDVAISGTSVPATYFDISNTPITSGPVFSNMEPSSFYVESSAVDYRDTVPVSAPSLAELPVDSQGSCVPKISMDYKMNTLKALPSLSTVRTSGASSGNDSSSFDIQPPAVPNNQSKVRSKKRTVVTTLRANKKVSSLVDKWKAVKEELHGDEEEPENALEILEKKRQKEIEAWRARQLATGEAQDNANFVPLGGDWRERVKHKRTDEATTEDAQTSSTPVAEKDKKQPDLVELSKGLPSGWQVYWDDSTKQVYYGNHSTSETTWSRPTS